MASLNYFDKDKQEWVAIPLGGTGGDSAITVHDGSIPNPTEETPKGLEDSFAAYADGLHYFKEPGTLVAITRQQYQTDITLTGPVSSSAKIVKSEGGLPTPQNPSMIVLKRADGQWIKMTSDELDKPFGQPQMVDLFALNGGGVDVLAEIRDQIIWPKQVVTDSVVFEQAYKLTVENVGIGPRAVIESSNMGVVSRVVCPDRNDVYTKTEIDTIVSENGQEHQVIESLVRDVAVQLGNSLALKADVATTYTKPEVDEAIAASISGQLSPAQIEELISQVGPVDLTDYAKKEDASQNVIANAFVGQGFVFGTQAAGSNPGLVYTDTNEGYGPRLILDTPGGKELIPYQSDFEPIKARMEALEGKQAVGVDAAAAAEAIQKVDLLGMEVGLSASACKNTAEKVQELEARITAINPIGSADINDPSLAAFKKSVLDEVKKMMAGGKAIPADVPWTKLLNAGNAANAPEAKVLNGIVYMRGEAVKQGGAGYSANAYQLPPTIPAPPREMVVPLAMKNTNPSGRYYGYATIQTNRQIGVSCDNSFNTVWFDGISYPAYE